MGSNSDANISSLFYKPNYFINYFIMNAITPLHTKNNFQFCKKQISTYLKTTSRKGKKIFLRAYK